MHFIGKKSQYTHCRFKVETAIVIENNDLEKYIDRFLERIISK